ncbi:MAG: hypothetical protein EOP07_24165 [Proteobacteria bacterium]|nr:MAG: hypothetical protein EOP07_24165 [Pseudomonadota bacterium]
MRLKLFMSLALTLPFLSAATILHAADQAPFAVENIPQLEPIAGQLGEPGAPALKEEQAALAKALLRKGICNATYYGEDFCKKQEARSFRVTDQISTTAPDAEVLPAAKAKL